MQSKVGEINRVDQITTDLFIAIKNRNLSEIRVLLEKGANLAAVNEDNKTPIQFAASLVLDDWGIVEVFAKSRHSDAKDTYRYGYVLLSAVIHEKLELAKCLLKAGAPTNWVTSDDMNTCLHWAVKHKNSKMIELLIDHDASLSALNKLKHTPMIFACYWKSWEVVNSIAKLRKMDTKDSYHYSCALYNAVLCDNLESVKCLLAADASPDWFSKDGSALHLAVKKNNTAMITLLLHHGAKKSYRNSEGQTPLELACALGHWDMADMLMQDAQFKLDDSTKAGQAYVDAIKAGQLLIASKLLDAGSSATHKTFEGNTALHWAVSAWNTVKDNKERLLTFVIEKGVNPATQNNVGKTAIELASELGHWHCVQLLIEKNNSQYKQNSTDLHYENVLFNAITKSNYAITKLVLKNGAPCDRWNSEMGNIALYLAVKHNEKTPKIVSLLLKYKASPSIKNKDAKNTYDFARQLKHHACLKRLEDHKKDMRSKALLTLKPTSIAREDLDKLRQDVSDLYDFMCDNSLMANILPVSIQELMALENKLLKSDYAILATRREALKRNPIAQTNYLTQTFDMHSDLGRLNTVMHTLNTLLNYPEQSPQINYLLSPYCAEENDIGIYLIIKQSITNYVSRLHLFLQDIRFAIDTIQWKEKNFFGLWVDGKPESIHALQKELLQLPKTPFSNEILDVYKKVAILLAYTFNKDDAHESTVQFYRATKSQMENMTFLPPFTAPNDMPATIYNTVDQLQPIYPGQPDYSQQYPLMTVHPSDLDNTVSVYAYNDYPLPQAESLLGPILQTNNTLPDTAGLNILGFFSQQTVKPDNGFAQFSNTERGELMW